MKALSAIVLLYFSLVPSQVEAQFSLPSDSATIDIRPAFPKPGDTVTVSLNAYTFDTTGATISWIINGTENTGLQNRRQFTLTAPALGESVLLESELRLREGQVIPARRNFTVSDVDLIVEAATLVPSFYQGRPLPSIGSTIQVVALPHTASNLSPEAYSYTWRFNNEVVEGGSVFGGYVGRFLMPVGKSSTLQVDVSDGSGAVVAQKSIVIPSYEPELHFYLDNPLRGLSRIALPKDYTLQGSEASFRAEPYFMDSNILNQAPLLEWKINGQVIDNPSGDKQTITLQNAGGIGTFNVEFHLRNLRQLLQGVRSGFNLSF